jgi:aerotaxis receptor
MIKPLPTQNEKPFDIEEFFFSRTDLKGIILFGNEVFTRISGYLKEQLVGAPHNIIRHPDMPKAVFKLLWDTIKSNQIIVAYVKNMSSDGSYYWVMATVFLLENEYLSVRFKPSSPVLTLVQEIYQKVLLDEKENGLESSEALLIKMIKEAGFKDYASFMTHALVTELQGRDEIISSKLRENVVDLKSKYSSLSESVKLQYKEIFNRVSILHKKNQNLDTETSVLFDQFIDFQLVSLNMRVMAGRMGEAGAAIVVVSQSFQSLIADIDGYLNNFSDLLTKLISTIQITNTSFELALIRLQVEMIDFFFHEYKTECTCGKKINLSCEDLRSLCQNAGIFAEISKNYSGKIQARSIEINLQLSQFIRATDDMRKFTNSIGIMSQMGAIEASRISEERDAFVYAIEHMTKLHGILGDTIRNLQNISNEIAEQMNHIDKTLILANRDFAQLIAEIESQTISDKTSSDGSSLQKSGA